MCRMFGFCAARPAAVVRSLIDEPNALKVQSHDHPDGWGIGYYPQDAEAPMVVRSLNSAFADREFAEAAGRVTARTVIAHVRRASCGPVTLENTHPFHHRRWLFAHNGTVSRFPDVRGALEAEIDGDLRGDLRGDTDSERCFLLILTRLRAHHPLDRGASVDAMAQSVRNVADLVHRLADAGAPEPSSLTFILSDGVSLVAYRDGRSLHYAVDALAGRLASELMVASEVLSAERTWAEVPPGGLVGVDESRALHRHFPAARLSA